MTDQLRVLHEQLLDVVGMCRDGALAAVQDGRTGLTAEEYAELNAALTELAAGLQAVYPEGL